MALILVKHGTSDEYSMGDGSDPTTLSVNLDDSSSPATEDSDVESADIKASTYLYSDITLSIINEDSGIDYKLSLDNSHFFDSLASGDGGDAAGEIADMDAISAPVTKQVYIKAVVNNDGTVTAGSHTTPDIRLAGTENQ